MISKKDILKMVRHVSKRSRGIPDRRLIHPKREWCIGLVIFVVIVFSGVFYNGHTYQRYNNIASELEEPTSGVVTYKANVVNETLEYYRERERRFTEQITTFTLPAEPVVPEENEEEERAVDTEDSVSEEVVTEAELEAVETEPGTETLDESTEPESEPVENVPSGDPVPVFD